MRVPEWRQEEEEEEEQRRNVESHPAHNITADGERKK